MTFQLNYFFVFLAVFFVPLSSVLAVFVVLAAFSFVSVFGTNGFIKLPHWYSALVFAESKSAYSARTASVCASVASRSAITVTSAILSSETSLFLTRVTARQVQVTCSTIFR